MPDVTKQLSLPAQGNYQGIVATLKLVAAVDQDGTGYVSSTSVDIAGESTTAPNNSGLITFTGVVANSLITPANTAYKLVVRFPDKTTTTEWIDVPNGAGPYSVADILTTEPSDLPPAGAENAVLGTDLTGTVSDAVIRAALKAELTNQTDLLTRWNAGLAVASTERVDVLLPCDSMTQPWSGASGGVISSWLELVADQLRVFGPVTDDWRPAGRTFGATWTTTGAYSAAIVNGFGAAGVELDPGEYWEDTFGGEATNAGDAVAVYVTMQASGGASAQVLIDGGEVKAATTTTGTAAQMVKFYESSLQDGAEHTVRVVASGSGTVKLDGILVHHGTLTEGIVLWNGSLSGSTIQDHLDAGGFEDHATQLIADDTLALVVLGSGLASYAYPGTATGAEWETETQNAIDMLDGLGSFASVLIVCEYEPAGAFQTLTSNWQGWATTMPPIMRTLAETNGCAFRSVAAALPTVAGTALASNGVDYWTWGATISGNTYDYTHTNARGQRQIADAIWPVISQVSTHAQVAKITDIVASTGDVTGPASATDSRIVTFDGTTGKLVQSEAAVLTDQTIEAQGGQVKATDGTAAHGVAALLSGALGSGISVANDTTDTQPAAYLGGTTSGLRLGPGGTTPADFVIARTGTAVATMTGALRTATAPSNPNDLTNKTYVDAQVDDLSGVTNAATARTNLGLGAWSTIPVHSATTGAWVGPNSTRTSTTALTAGLGKEVWTAVWLDAGTYDRIAVYVTTGATSTWRLGLDAISSNGVPTGSALLDAGTVNMSGAAGQRAITISHSITTAGWYWARVKVEAYTANPTVVALSGTTSPDVAPPILGWPTQEASYLRGYPGLYYNGSGAGGALTSSPSLTNNSATGLAYAEVIPVVWFRRA